MLKLKTELKYKFKLNSDIHANWNFKFFKYKYFIIFPQQHATLKFIYILIRQIKHTIYFFSFVFEEKKSFTKLSRILVKHDSHIHERAIKIFNKVKKIILIYFPWSQNCLKKV